MEIRGREEGYEALVENILYIVFEYAESNHKIISCFLDEGKAMDTYRENPTERYIVTQGL